MICNGYDKVLELRDRDLVDLRDARGTTIRVTRGTLWITQANDTRDIVLRAGDVWTVERHGLTMVESQGDSTLCLAGAAGGSRARAAGLTRVGGNGSKLSSPWLASAG